MDIAMVVEIALFVLTFLFGLIGWLSNSLITRTLKQIDQNQEKLAQVLERDIKRLENRQEQLECNQKETDEKLNTLLGEHKVIMDLGGHKE